MLSSFLVPFSYEQELAWRGRGQRDIVCRQQSMELGILLGQGLDLLHQQRELLAADTVHGFAADKTGV